MPRRAATPSAGFAKLSAGKRSVVIAGHKTSVSLEEVFWTGLKEIAAARNMPVNELVAEIAKQVAKGQHVNLSVFVLEFYRELLTRSPRRRGQAVSAVQTQDHCGGTFAHTATNGLRAVCLGGQETDLSFMIVTAALPGPQ
jgi:predicted DNA-binding ribbon-helix-helix protein